MQEAPSARARGLFGSLYDFGFTSLITTRVVRFVYGLLVVVYTLVAVGLLIAFVSKGGSAVALGIIAVPIGYFLYLVFLRIMMEFFIMVFRIGEDIRAMRVGGDRLGAAWPSMQGPARHPGQVAWQHPDQYPGNLPGQYPMPGATQQPTQGPGQRDPAYPSPTLPQYPAQGAGLQSAGGGSAQPQQQAAGAAQTPVSQGGQLSADGRYRWDGQSWQPVPR